MSYYPGHEMTSWVLPAIDARKPPQERHNARHGCEVVTGDWPYECVAKDRYPSHLVRICMTHRCWWHEPPEVES